MTTITPGTLVTTDSPKPAIRARLGELDIQVMLAEIGAYAAAECAAKAILADLPDSAAWHARSWAARHSLVTELRMQRHELTGGTA